MTFTPNRRHFLGALGTAFAAPALLAQETPATEPTLIDSPPSLQCPTRNAITVVWAVGQPAAGFVQFGTDKDNLDQAAYGDVFGQKAYHRRFLQIRIEGLQPNTRYYYRTVTRAFRFVNAYNFVQGEPVYGEVYSFQTPGENKAIGTFSVINDTHNNQPLIKAVGDRLRSLQSDYTVWNGDLFNGVDSEQTAIDATLRHGGVGFSMEKPLLFVPGNHDYRGEWARNLPLCLATWDYNPPEPIQLAQWSRPLVDPTGQPELSQGRNFVVRNGPLALIGLDTGEDKPDNRSEWAGLARFEPYRVRQHAWLERVLQSETVASAPFVLAFCHIPLFDSRPNANGGDLPTGYASFQRQAGDLWGPLLTQYGVQAVIAAHTHRVRYDQPTEDRTWAQIIGGTSSLDRGDVTVIHGKAEGGKLEIVVEVVNRNNKEWGHWTFAPRRG